VSQYDRTLNTVARLNNISAFRSWMNDQQKLPV